MLKNLHTSIGGKSAASFNKAGYFFVRRLTRWKNVNLSCNGEAVRVRSLIRRWTNARNKKEWKRRRIWTPLYSVFHRGYRCYGQVGCGIFNSRVQNYIAEFCSRNECTNFFFSNLTQICAFKNWAYFQLTGTRPVNLHPLFLKIGHPAFWKLGTLFFEKIRVQKKTR